MTDRRLSTIQWAVIADVLHKFFISEDIYDDRPEDEIIPILARIDKGLAEHNSADEVHSLNSEFFTSLKLALDEWGKDV